MGRGREKVYLPGGGRYEGGGGVSGEEETEVTIRHRLYVEHGEKEGSSHEKRI